MVCLFANETVYSLVNTKMAIVHFCDLASQLKQWPSLSFPADVWLKHDPSYLAQTHQVAHKLGLLANKII